MSRTRIAGQITAASLAMLLASSFAPRPASPMVEECVEYRTYKLSWTTYEHGGPSAEPEVGSEYMGKFDAEPDPENDHTDMEGGTAEAYHDPCEGGGDPD